MTKSRDRGESPGGPPDAFGHFEDFEDWEGPEPQNVPRNVLRILSRAGLRPAILSLGLHHLETPAVSAVFSVWRLCVSYSVR